MPLLSKLNCWLRTEKPIRCLQNYHEPFSFPKIFKTENKSNHHLIQIHLTSHILCSYRAFCNQSSWKQQVKSLQFVLVFYLTMRFCESPRTLVQNMNIFSISSTLEQSFMSSFFSHLSWNLWQYQMI